MIFSISNKWKWIIRFSLILVLVLPYNIKAATVSYQMEGFYTYDGDNKVGEHKTGAATQTVDLSNVAQLQVNFYCVATAYQGTHNAFVTYNSVRARIRNASGTVLATSENASMPATLYNGSSDTSRTENSGNKTLVINVPASARSTNMYVDVYADVTLYCGSVTIYHTSDTVAQSAHTHSYTTFVKTVTAATCTANRVDQYKCSCGLTTNKTIANTAKGHSYTYT